MQYADYLKKEVEKCKQTGSKLYTDEDIKYRDWLKREFPSGVPAHTSLESLRLSFNLYKYGKR